MVRGRGPSSDDTDGDDDSGDVEMEDNEGSRSSPGTSRTEHAPDTSDPVIAGLQASMNNLLQLVKDIIPTCYTEEKKAEVSSRMKDCMLKLIRSEKNYVTGLKLVEQTAKSMPDPDPEEDADDQAILGHCEQLKTTALEKVSEHRQGLKDSNLKKHPYYVQLEKEIQGELTQSTQPLTLTNGAPQDESDGEEEEAEDVDLENDDGAEMIPVTDPITKLPLTDPIRNKYCLHIYGKASMLAIVQTLKTRCPTVGCPNKRWITERHLVEDAELTLKVQKRVREAQRNRANAQNEED